MELEHLIGLALVVVFSLLAAWVVWKCMCKSEDDDDDDIESQQDEEVKSVNSRTKVISTRDMDEGRHFSGPEKRTTDAAGNLIVLTKKGKNSSYVHTGREKRFADPFGEWQRREKAVDDVEALSGIRTYRKSPVLPHRS